MGGRCIYICTIRGEASISQLCRRCNEREGGKGGADRRLQPMRAPSWQIVAKLLSSDLLNVSSEICAFRALCKWILALRIETVERVR